MPVKVVAYPVTSQAWLKICRATRNATDIVVAINELDTRTRVRESFYSLAKWKKKQGVPVVDKAFWVVMKHKVYIL